MNNEKIGKFTVKQVGAEADRVLRFLGTDESEDRDGDIIKADGWRFESYLKNPVFLWCHDSWSVPIGKCVAISRGTGSTGTEFDIKFASIDELSTNPATPSREALLADTVYNAYRNGYLNAVSVGFIGLESEENESQVDLPVWERGRVFTSQEMIELSAVPVPANPNALIQARSFKGWRKGEFEMLSKILSDGAKIKGAIPYKKFPLADKDAAWDGPAIIKEADNADLRVICAWFDSSKAEDELTKGDFKLPHHLGSADGHKTVWAGVKAAMGALLGARGGVNIPDADREKVYKHLAKHYEDFDEEAPEFKGYAPEELKAMFPEQELDMKKDEVDKAIAEAVQKAVKPLMAEIEALKAGKPLAKAGAKHSAATIEKMQAAMTHIMNGYNTIKGLLDGDGEEPGGQNPSETEPGVDRPGNAPAPGDEEGDDAQGKAYGIDLSQVDLSEYESA